MSRLLATAITLAVLTQAQSTEIEVTDSSTQTNPIEVSTRPTNDVPNLSAATTTSVIIDTSAIPTILTSSLPIIPISSVSNHINGNNTYTATTVTPGTASGNCVTVTMQGEPMFTIQTDTVLEMPCTYTVFAGTSSISSDVLTTTTTSGSGTGSTTVVTGTASTTPAPSSSSGAAASQSSAPATQSGNIANRAGMGSEALGLVAFIGALGLL